MVTGDHHLTATAVAQVTGILNFKRPHILIAETELLRLPTASSPTSITATGPANRLGPVLRTRSAAPVDLKALAELNCQPQPGSSRSKSFSQIELSALKDVSRARFSSKLLVPKRALTTNHMQTSQADAQQQQPPQIDGPQQNLLLARSSERFALTQLSAQSNTDNLAHLQQPAAAEPDPTQDELSFIMADEGRLGPLSRREALTMIGMGHQCIITGCVFDHLVQHADPAFLETVLHNVAVCARMKAHQKAQLVLLLSDQGLTVSCTRKFKVNECFLALCYCCSSRFTEVGDLVYNSHLLSAFPHDAAVRLVRHICL